MQLSHELEIYRENEALTTLQIENLRSLLTSNSQVSQMDKKELNAFKLDIAQITKQLDKAENIVRKVKQKLKDAPIMQHTWETYLEIFSKVHPDFQISILNKYANLTSMEVKVCVLIRAGLSSEEVSEILSLSPRTIESHRLHIRKKIGVSERENLSSFLINY